MFKKHFSIIIMILIIITTKVFSVDKLEDSLKVYKMPSITVTSTKAIEGKSPIPFTEISRSELDKSYSLKDVPDFLSDMTSLMSYSESGNAIGYSHLSIRGFDQRRVAVLVNGVPQNDPEDHNVYWIDFPDIASSVDNIQVQRGAGLINYGAAAIAGSINLTTSNFTLEKGVKLFSGMGIQEFGNNGDAKYQSTMSKFSIEASSGLTNNYAIYAHISRINSLGYRTNSWAEMNNFFISAVRFDENITTQINVFGGISSDALIYNGLPKSYITNTNLRKENYSYWYYDKSGQVVDNTLTTVRRKDETEEFTQPHFEILNNIKINDKLTLLSTLFYYSGDGYYDFADDWADATTLRLTPEYGFDSNAAPTNALIRAYVSNKHGGWVPRLVYIHDNGILTIGAELRIHRSEHWGKVEAANNLPTDYYTDYKIYSYEGKRDIYSLFAREVYSINEKLNADAEFQVVRQGYGITNEKWGNNYSKYVNINGDTIGNGNEIFNVGFWFFNPRLGLNYLLDNNTNVYLSTAYTSREPRMSNIYQAEFSYYGNTPEFEGVKASDGTIHYDFSKPLVKPEKMLDFEMGISRKVNNYSFGANFYWMEYYDELVNSGTVDPFGNPIDGNAKRTRHYGIELQGSYIIFEQSDSKLLLSANAAFSKNKIIDYKYILDSKDTISLNNNPVSGFPSSIGNLILSYQNSNIFVSVTGKYVGSFRTDNFGDMLTNNSTLINYLTTKGDYYIDNTVDSYFILNANFVWTIKDYAGFNSLKFKLQGYNLLNKLYASSGTGKEFYPGGERNIFFGIEIGL